ncbi:MAG: hypothetical protein M2R45_02039 [Verrucomicrobia subdivision 3 bacterium]|nr:hypothetical protein [Limisphaerales bacterium]MCS1414859.1 hypothetical protein [Limisphaerales bacterium]
MVNLGRFLRLASSWGDGLSIPLLNGLSEAGGENAVLLLSDLYSKSVRPDVVTRVAELGFLIGLYDSYHSVHSSDASPDGSAMA